MKGTLAWQESSRLALRGGHEIATAERLQREREQFTAADRLRSEQKRVAEFVLDSRDQIVAISGAAGTGKTAKFSRSPQP